MLANSLAKAVAGIQLPLVRARGLGIGAAMLLLAGTAIAEPTPTELAEMKIEDLLSAKVTVSSVARRPGTVDQSPAAITVITQEDIRRSGATSIAEVLRMVPGMDVANVDAHEWAISTRGFNGLFANKLLVMMDGRSVYTSLFSGTSWDAQDAILDDIDRIEVVRGPGASLWGANAVNGVINIVTKSAAQTQGGLVSTAGGNEERAYGAFRYGGKLGDDLHFRVYAKYNARDESGVFGRGFPEALIKIDTGSNSGTVTSAVPAPNTAHDAWQKAQGGFRMDWTPAGANRITLQGDVYRAWEDQTYQRITPATFGVFYERVTDIISGGNVLGRWTHTFSNTSESILQVYYDRSNRDLSVLGENRHTFDLDFQHQFAVGQRQTVVWGAGYRRSEDRIRNTLEVGLVPPRRTAEVFSAFAQDEISLVPKRLSLTLGARLEHNDFTGREIQPNARLIWTANARNTFWAAVSRAVRTPSRAEDDFQVNLPGVPANVIFPGGPAITIGIRGDRDFESEKLTAYEIGYRTQPVDRLSVDATAFYYEYTGLRGFELANTSLDFTHSPVEIVVKLGNLASAETYGGEVSLNFRVNSAWRMRADYSLLQMRVHSATNLTLGSLGTTEIAGSNPQQQVAFRSWFDLPHGLEFDSTLRWVDELPSLGVPAYLGFDLRLGWRVSDHVELSLVGQNLLDPQHPESTPSFFASQATEVERGYYLKATVRF